MMGKMFSSSRDEHIQYFKSYEIEMDYKEKYLKLLERVIAVLGEKEKDDLIKEIQFEKDLVDSEIQKMDCDFREILKLTK